MSFTFASSGSGVRPVLFSAVAAIGFVAVARAELLVLDRGGSGRAGLVQRIDGATGAVLSRFGVVNEGLRSLSYTGDQVYVSAATLGDTGVYSFTPDGVRTGMPAAWKHDGEYGNVERAPDGTVYSTVYDSAVGRRHLVRIGGGLPVNVDTGMHALVSPEYIALGPDGTIYAHDRVLGIVRMSRRDGSWIGTVANIGTTDPNDVVRLAFDRDGRLYISSRAANALYRVSHDGSLTTLVGGAGSALKQPVGLAFAPDGSLYVACLESRQILRYDAEAGSLVQVVATLRPPQVVGDLAYIPEIRPRFEGQLPAAADRSLAAK